MEQTEGVQRNGAEFPPQSACGLAEGQTTSTQIQSKQIGTQRLLALTPRLKHVHVLLSFLNSLHAVEKENKGVA